MLSIKSASLKIFLIIALLDELEENVTICN